MFVFFLLVFFCLFIDQSIECPSSENGMDRFACPTRDELGRFLCIDDQHICDGYFDCPHGEDEERLSCMFYKSVSNQ